MQSDEQKSFVQELSANRDRLQDKIESLLYGIVEQLVDKKPLAIEAASNQPTLATKSEAAVQTDNDRLPSASVEPSVSSGTSAGSPDLAMRPLPQGEEALRMEVSALTGQLIEKQSRVHSLEQASVDLRTSIGLLMQEQEKLTAALRLAEAEILTRRQTEYQLTSEHTRAANEVQNLRAAIAEFHKPGNRLYESVKDAMERRMRGEPPLTPPIFARPQKRLENEGHPDMRPHKRPRVSSMDTGIYQMPPVNPHPHSQPSTPHRGVPPPLPNGDNRMRLVQSAPGPPPQGRPTDQIHMQPTQSAPGSSQHRPIEIRSSSNNQPNVHPYSQLQPHQPSRTNTLPTPSQAQLSALAQNNINNSFINNPFTQTIPAPRHPSQPRPPQQHSENKHNRSRSGTNNGGFPSGPPPPANPPGGGSMPPSSGPVPYKPIPPPPEPVLYVNPQTNEFIWAHPGQKIPIPHPPNSSRPALVPAANSSSAGSARDQPIVVTPTSTTPTSANQPHFPNNTLPSAQSSAPQFSPQNQQKALPPQASLAQAPRPSPSTNQSFDRQMLDAMATQSATAAKNWVKTVTDINTEEARTIAEAVFPILYGLDPAGVTVCQVCGGRAEKRDFNTMFFHLFTRHKAEYDAVLNVTKGAKTAV